MLAMEASSSTRHRHEVSRTPRRSYGGRFEPSSGAQRLLLSGWVAGVPRTAHGRRRNEKGGSADAEPALHFGGAEAPPYDRNAGLTRPAHGRRFIPRRRRALSRPSARRRRTRTRSRDRDPCPLRSAAAGPAAVAARPPE